MKVEKFKQRYRVTLLPPNRKWTWSVKNREKVYRWCLDRFGLTEDERWIAPAFRPWSVSRNKCGLYVYFKNESDVTMFLLGFSIKNIND